MTHPIAESTPDLVQRVTFLCNFQARVVATGLVKDGWDIGAVEDAIAKLRAERDRAQQEWEAWRVRSETSERELTEAIARAERAEDSDRISKEILAEVRQALNTPENESITVWAKRVVNDLQRRVKDAQQERDAHRENARYWSDRINDHNRKMDKEHEYKSQLAEIRMLLFVPDGTPHQEVIETILKRRNVLLRVQELEREREAHENIAAMMKAKIEQLERECEALKAARRRVVDGKRTPAARFDWKPMKTRHGNDWVCDPWPGLRLECRALRSADYPSFIGGWTVLVYDYDILVLDEPLTRTRVQPDQLPAAKKLAEDFAATWIAENT
jgi:hypothetical protein